MTTRSLPAAIDPSRYYRSNAPELDALGASASTRAKWRCMNVGPAYIKSGKAVLYLGSDLLSWLESNRVKTGTVIRQPE